MGGETSWEGSSTSTMRWPRDESGVSAPFSLIESGPNSSNWRGSSTTPPGRAGARPSRRRRSSGSSTHLGHQARGGDALEHPWRGFLHRGGAAYQTGCSGARPRFLHPRRPGRGRPPRLRDPGAPAPQAVGGGADCPPGTRRQRDGLSGDGRRGGHSPACLGTNGPTPKIHTGQRNGRRRRGGSVVMGSLIPGRNRAVAAE